MPVIRFLQNRNKLYSHNFKYNYNNSLKFPLTVNNIFMQLDDILKKMLSYNNNVRLHINF